MKKISILIIFAICVSLSIFALRDRRQMTPEQELAVFSLANRYVDAFCHRPYDIAPVLLNTFIPPSLIEKSQEFLVDLLQEEGECYGYDKTKIQEGLLREIRKLPRNLVEFEMATDFAFDDFINCLVNVERSTYELSASTTRILECVDIHLDVRGFWYQVLVKNREWIPDDDVIIIQPPILVPVEPTPQETCFDECFNDCQINCQEFIEPVPEN